MSLLMTKDSDQPGCPPSLNRVFAVCKKKAWVLSYLLSAQRRFWSKWADAHADLNHRWAHSHFVCFVMRRRIYSICSRNMNFHSELIWWLSKARQAGSNGEYMYQMIKIYNYYYGLQSQLWSTINMLIQITQLSEISQTSWVFCVRCYCMCWHVKLRVTI